MTDSHEWATPAQLDRVVIGVEWDRSLVPARAQLRVTGLSNKVSHPLWTWSVEEEDDRNIGPVLGGVLDAVSFYRPTTTDKFLRACVGGVVAEEDPTLF